MHGAIAGEIIGSAFANRSVKTTDFELLGTESAMTDDSVLTVATAYAILSGGDYGSAYRKWGKIYANASYEPGFLRWLFLANSGPYATNENATARRVSPIGWAFNSIDEVLKEAKKSASITHAHADAVKGAQAVATAIFMARTGSDTKTIKKELEGRFRYDLSTPLDKIRPSYSADVTSKGSVPQALRAFLESANWESSIRNAISLGGHSKSQSAISGSVAEATFDGVPENIWTECRNRIPEPMRNVCTKFSELHSIPQAA